MTMARPPGRRIKCRAHSKRTGLPCGAWAKTGWAVCRMHGAGGGAPPEKLRGNTNAVSTGERASVLAARLMLINLEPPDTPQAMLRNQVRRLQARDEFMTWLLLDVEEAMVHFDVTGEWKGSPEIPVLTPECVEHGPLALCRAVRRQGVSKTGRPFDQTKLVYQSLFRRWLALHDALNRIGASIGRAAEQLRAFEDRPAGTSTMVVGTAWSTFGVQAAAHQEDRSA